MVVSSVQHVPSLRRRMPRPRDTWVSKVNHASVTPPSTFASPSIFQLDGFASPSVAFSIASISARPSKVLIFHVNDTKSRQKHVSPNNSTAAFVFLLVRAASSFESQVETAVVSAVVTMFSFCWEHNSGAFLKCPQWWFYGEEENPKFTTSVDFYMPIPSLILANLELPHELGVFN